MMIFIFGELFFFQLVKLIFENKFIINFDIMKWIEYFLRG